MLWYHYSESSAIGDHVTYAIWLYGCTVVTHSTLTLSTLVRYPTSTSRTGVFPTVPALTTDHINTNDGTNDNDLYKL